MTHPTDPVAAMREALDTAWAVYCHNGGLALTTAPFDRATFAAGFNAGLGHATARAKAMRDALEEWARFCVKWPAKEGDDGIGYYSEADHDQAACYAATLVALSLPPAPARLRMEDRHVDDRCPHGADMHHVCITCDAPAASAPADDAVARALRDIKAMSLGHHAHEDSAVLLHALLVEIPTAIDAALLAAERAASGPATGNEKGNNEGGSRE